jgi:hypothetical protein
LENSWRLTFFFFVENKIKYFYRHRNPVSVQHLLNEAFKMQKSTPSDIDPCKLLRSFEPLTKGTYPVFNKQPRFISDYQILEKSKILKQEIEYLKEREVHLESHKLTEGRKLESEYMFKQLLWEKAQNQMNNKMYKQSVDEYEKRQRHLENVRLRNQQAQSGHAKISSEDVDAARIMVGGEPVLASDKHGHVLFNKMKKIDENFDEIQNIVRMKKSNDFRRLKIEISSYFYVFSRLPRQESRTGAN